MTNYTAKEVKQYTQAYENLFTTSLGLLEYARTIGPIRGTLSADDLKLLQRGPAQLPKRLRDFQSTYEILRSTSRKIVTDLRRTIKEARAVPEGLRSKLFRQTLSGLEGVVSDVYANLARINARKS